MTELWIDIEVRHHLQINGMKTMPGLQEAASLRCSLGEDSG